ERGVEREMSATELEPPGVLRQQRERDAEVVDVAEQVVGIMHAECESEQRRDRRERDVALVERESYTHYVGTVPFALADDAVVGDRGGVRARVRAGQRETRDLAAVGEARQVVV